MAVESATSVISLIPEPAAVGAARLANRGDQRKGEKP